MATTKTRSGHPVSQSAPTTSSMKDVERRGGRRRAKELTCETCGKVYKHPVCLQKHRWEHNPLWRETAQFLLSKHQQVQVMEAAAILVHGSSLPTDRALWPIYMSGGSVDSPLMNGDVALQDSSSTPQYRATSLSPAISSIDPPASQFDDEELDIVSEEEQGGEDDDDEKTDESDSPPSAFSHSLWNTRTTTRSGRERSSSVGVAAPAATRMPNVYGSYGWGVITDSGQHTSFPGGKSPVFESLPYSPASPRPMAIPNATSGRGFLGHQSMSSFGSFGHSFGSSSTSSYIPSSSVRGSSTHDDEEPTTIMEEDDISYNINKTNMIHRSQTFTEAITRREEEFDELEMDMD